MKTKNPWIAAILNFLFSGLGFVYLWTPLYILGGLTYFLFSLLGWAAILSYPELYPQLAWMWVLSLGSGLAWAILGYEAAESINRNVLQPPSPSLPLPPPQPQPLATPQVAPSTQIAEKKYCRYCGAQNRYDAVFCEACGKKVG